MRVVAPVQGPSEFPEQTPHSSPRPGSAMLTLPSSWASFVSVALAQMKKMTSCTRAGAVVRLAHFEEG